MHWLPVHGKKQVSFMVEKGGQVASIWYYENQGLEKAPAHTPVPFCTLLSLEKMLLFKLWSLHKAA